MAENVTASAIISFAERLEDRSAEFYEQLVDRFPEREDEFLTFAEQGAKNKTLVVRTYRETISDALEACFSFEGVDLDAYAAESAELLGGVSGDVSYTKALNTAVELEDQAVEFYDDIAERSRSLMATIPMAFRSVAKTRGRRKRELQSLLDEAE